MPKPIAPAKPKATWRTGLRLVVWSAILGGAALGEKQVNAFLLRDPRFELHCEGEGLACADLQVNGAVFASRARIQAVFQPDFGASVFRIPLAERRRRLLAVDWVNGASVSRVWPSRIAVSVTERRPAAFVKMPVAGSSRYRFSLIDADGVLLTIPPRTRFRLPVLSGLTEDQSEIERSARVKAMQDLLNELGPRAKDISEINAANTMDMRLIADLDGHAVELMLGNQHYGSRYMHFWNHYQEIRRHSEQATVFDLRLDDRILARR